MLNKFIRGRLDLGIMISIWGISLPLVRFVQYTVDANPDSLLDLLLNAILTVFILIWSLGTWRSASRYSGPRIWAILAKILVIFYWLLISFILIDGAWGFIDGLDSAWFGQAFLGLGIGIFLFKGIPQTFKRSTTAAVLLLIFAFPLLLVWAFFEMFLDEPDKVVKVKLVDD